MKNVLDIFVEIGMGRMDQYENDFEAAMLKDTLFITIGKLIAGFHKIQIRCRE